MQNLNILIADDHTIIRKGIKSLLDSEFSITNVFETESCKKIMDLLEARPFTHLILDMQLLDGNIMGYLQEIRSKFPSIQILIYSMSPEEIFGRRMLQLGADSYLSKQSPESEIIKALSLFLTNKKYISTSLQEQLDKDKKNRSREGMFNPLNELSDRETLVLAYLLKGEGVKEISNRLDVKPNTVATFKARLFNKLGVTNVIDLRNIAHLYNFQGGK